MCERYINWLPLVRPQLGTWPTTQACALTGNRTGDISVCRPALNPLRHTSQGGSFLLFFFPPPDSRSEKCTNWPLSNPKLHSVVSEKDSRCPLLGTESTAGAVPLHLHYLGESSQQPRGASTLITFAQFRRHIPKGQGTQESQVTSQSHSAISR